MEVPMVSQAPPPERRRSRDVTVRGPLPAFSRTVKVPSTAPSAPSAVAPRPTRSRSVPPKVSVSVGAGTLFTVTVAWVVAVRLAESRTVATRAWLPVVRPPVFQLNVGLLPEYAVVPSPVAVEVRPVPPVGPSDTVVGPV